MFVTYPAEATTENWIHDCICHAFTVICNALNAVENIPEWPDTIPAEHRNKLRRKIKIKRLINDFSAEASQLPSPSRNTFLEIMTGFNQIPALLDGTQKLPEIPNELATLLGLAKAVCEEGFELLKKTGVRDAHYSVVWDSLENKKCPFCGCEPFEAPGMKREDEDHYLPRDIYPLSGANLYNLVPMGGKCNKLYKGKTDILRPEGIRRRVLNPYGNLMAELTLVNSDPLGSPDNTPTWTIDLLPDVEEVATLDQVFSVRERLRENQLVHYYESWLSALVDWFKVQNLDSTVGDDDLFQEIDNFIEYTRKDSESGPIFLKSKVAEMLVHHCRAGNRHVVAMLRAGLPEQPVAA